MNLFDLQAKLTLDSSGFESGLDKAKNIVSKIGSGITTAMGIGTAAIGAAATAVGALGAKAVSSYASYEQLVGGVEKLYGDAAEKLQAFADQAYKTSGMSANQYMETATSFSAALINSLGGDVSKAADMTDVAMKAMSDNINVFGSSADSVRNAFMGFAKQNYTMLDNLKLGYGGTKTEMERLIADANAYRKSIGQSADLSIEKFADVVQAIQSVQEAQNIAGTTNKEAMITIEGSATATRAAWQNVITAIGRGENLKEAFDALTSSLFGGENGGGMLSNIIPRIQKVMEGIGDFVATAGPLLSEKIPPLIESILPGMLEGGVSLIGALADGLLQAIPTVISTVESVLWRVLGTLSSSIPSIVSTVNALIPTIAKDVLPQLVMTGIRLLTDWWDFLIGVIPTLIEQIPGLIEQAVWILYDYFPDFVKAGTGMLNAIANGFKSVIPTLIEQIPWMVSMIIDDLLWAIPEIMQAAISLFSGLLDALPTVISGLLGALPTLITSIVDFLIQAIPQLVDAGIQLFTALVGALPEIINSIVEHLPEIITAIVLGILDLIPEIIQAGFDLFVALITNLPEIIVEIVKAVPQIIKGIIDGFKEKWEDIKEAGKQIFTKFKDGLLAVKDAIGNVVTKVKDNMEEKFSKIKDNAQEKFSAMRDNLAEIFGNIKDKVTETWQNILDIPIVKAIADWVTDTFNTLKETLTGIFEGIRSMAEGAWELIKNVILAPVLLLIDLVTGDTEKFKEDLTKIWENIKEAGKKIWDGLGQALLNIVKGVIDLMGNAFKAFGKLLQTIWEGIKNKAIEIWTNLKNKVVETAKNMIESVTTWVKKLPDVISEWFGKAVEFIKDLPGQALQWGKDLIQNFIDGIKQMFGKIGETLGNVAQGIRDFLGFSEPKKGPLSNFHTYAPDMMNLFIKGIKDNQDALQDAVANAFDFESLITSPMAGVDITGRTPSGSGKGVSGSNNYYTINVNQPVSTPADMLREIRTESQYGLMIGEALA